MKKIVITIIVLLAVAGTLYKGRSLLKERQAEVENEKLPLIKPISVKIIKPKQEKLEAKADYLATIEADKSVKLSTKLAGYIKKVTVDDSDSVKKGQLLVEIDDAEVLSNISSLKATLASQLSDVNLAKTIYNRNIKLYKVGGLAKEMLENSKVALSLKSAKAKATKEKIAQLQNQLKYLKIKAPFDGIVDKVLLHEGDLAATGRPIVSISTKAKKLIFTFPPEVTYIKKGLKVFSDNKEIGKVDIVNTDARAGLSSAEVKLYKAINRPNGAQIEISVLTANKNGCKVTLDALMHKKDGVYVMVYKDKKFTPKKVNVILEGAQDALLESCPNEPIAVAPETKLAQLPAYSNVNIIGANNE